MPRLIYADKAGTKVPGVTTVLGSSLGWKTPGLVHWAWKLGSEGKDYKAERNKAADAGTLAHACAEAIVTSRDLPEIPDEFRDAVNGNVSAFRRWLDYTRLRLVASEIPLVSEILKYGGCLDAVGVADEAAQIVDFKSSKDLYPDAIVQVAAYSDLWDENHPDLPIRGWNILRWSPDGAFHHHSLSADQIAAGRRVFRAALAIYNDRNAVKGRAA
jgi:hypothetical protein